MSNNLPVEAPDWSDMSPEEYSALLKFKEEGAPGASRIPDQMVFKWHNLYLIGKSYAEIASQTKSDIVQILYISDRHKWPVKKDEYFRSIADTLQSRIMNTRMEGLNFLTDVMNMYHKTMGTKIKKYLETNDEKILESVDIKSLDKYFKTIEVVDKLVFKKDEDDPRKTNQFFNFFGNASIRKKDDNTVEISSEPSSDIDLLEMEKFRDASKDQKE